MPGYVLPISGRSRPATAVLTTTPSIVTRTLIGEVVSASAAQPRTAVAVSPSNAPNGFTGRGKSARHSFAPNVPVADRPCEVWKLRTALAVPAPYTPSAVMRSAV